MFLSVNSQRCLFTGASCLAGMRRCNYDLILTCCLAGRDMVLWTPDRHVWVPEVDTAVCPPGDLLFWCNSSRGPSRTAATSGPLGLWNSRPLLQFVAGESADRVALSRICSSLNRVMMCECEAGSPAVRHGT